MTTFDIYGMESRRDLLWLASLPIGEKIPDVIIYDIFGPQPPPSVVAAIAFLYGDWGVASKWDLSPESSAPVVMLCRFQGYWLKSRGEFPEALEEV